MIAASQSPRSLRPAPIQLLTSPVRIFLQIEAASGFVLVIATLVALIVANTAAGPAMHDFWHMKLGVGCGTWEFRKPLEFWINDGLMAIFFFVVGLEIKRELMTGELRTLRKAALPVIAAIGGMAIPAAVYLLVNHQEGGSRGWAIPMATDIAFVVGIQAAIGKRVPLGLKVFLLSLAIADDIGAILVIAIAYTDHLNWFMLGGAALGFGLTLLLNQLGVRAIAVYGVAAVVTWYAMSESGIHPTIAGVVFGLLTPHRAWLGRDALRLALDDVSGRLSDQPDVIEVRPDDVAVLRYAAQEVVSPLRRLEDRLHPWVGFVIMPLFALANAGVEVQLATLGERISLACIAGLLLGKPLGIVLFSVIAVRCGVAALPSGVTWRHLVAGGVLGGIGFTMSLFVASLAFGSTPEMLAEAKMGVLVGSALSALVGAVLLATARNVLESPR